jgi:hypothetical protein
VANTMYAVSEGASSEPLPHGTRVDVRSRFVGSWTRGFEVDEPVVGGYRIRRVSDGSVLPDVLAEDEIRPERRKQGLWWA